MESPGSLHAESQPGPERDAAVAEAASLALSSPGAGRIRMTELNARRIAQTILDGFNRHYRIFREITAAARQRFEACDWRASARRRATASIFTPAAWPRPPTV